MGIQYTPAQNAPRVKPNVAQVIAMIGQKIQGMKQQRFEKKLMDAILKSSSPEEMKVNIQGVVGQTEKKRGVLGTIGNAVNPFGDYTGGIDPSLALTLKKMMMPEEAKAPLKGTLEYWKSQGLDDTEAAKAVRMDAGIEQKADYGSDPFWMNPANANDPRVKKYFEHLTSDVGEDSDYRKAEKELSEENVLLEEASKMEKRADDLRKDILKIDEVIQTNGYGTKEELRKKYPEFDVKGDIEGYAFDRMSSEKLIKSRLANVYEARGKLNKALAISRITRGEYDDAIRRIEARPADADDIIKGLKLTEKRAKAGPKADVSGVSKGKKLDAETARAILNEAGGDKDKARELARERGYEF